MVDTCPKCGYAQVETDECPRCRVIVSKYRAYLESLGKGTQAQLGSAKTRWSLWAGKIETEQDAIQVIKASSNGFYTVAGIQLVIGLLLAFLRRAAIIEAIIDPLVYASLSLLLRKFRSRVVAVILLSYSCATLVVTIINKFGGDEGGQNVILAIIVFWTSVRAIQASFTLNKLSTSAKSVALS